MLSFQKAQTGKRLYNGVSQSPNRGQVSAFGAQGYIKRELRNQNRSGVLRQIGGDGKSDSRSTVAAQALNRNKPRAGGKNPPPRPGNRGGGRPNVNPPKGGNQGGGGNGGGIQVPTIQVNEDGILQLPYDQSLSVEQLAAFNDANEQLLGLKVEGDVQAQQYGADTRNAQAAYNSLRKQTLNQNAAGGTAFSSQYGTAVAQNAGSYANQMSDLSMQNTNFLNNQNLQRAGIQGSLNQQLAALAQQYANDLNDSAGTLGYGNAPGRTPRNRNKKRRNRNRGKK